MIFLFFLVMMICVNLNTTFKLLFHRNSNSLKFTRLYETFSNGMVVLKPKKDRLFSSNGNPLVYSGAIEHVKNESKLITSDVVEVADNSKNVIGKGFYNPYSQYRVRLMCTIDEKHLMNSNIDDIISTRLVNAISLRKACNLPNDCTNAYRLVNGEGDRLSGLIIDVLGRFIVVQSGALWVEKYRKIIEEVLKSSILFSKNNDDNNNNNNIEKTILIWRKQQDRLNMDGFKDNDNYQDNNNDHHEKYTKINNELSNEMEASEVKKEEVNYENVLENGIIYKIAPFSGQKTGFYCDQRDNRMMIRNLSKNKDVLDCYCYSGGFALNAMKGEAKSIVAIDSSHEALTLAKSNFLLNNIISSSMDNHNDENINKNIVENDKISFLQGDAVKMMRNLHDQQKLFDIVIVDPPKFAPTQSSLSRAQKKYLQVNEAALNLVRSGGLLLTHSCSAVITQRGILKDVIRKAAINTGKKCTVLKTSGPGIDHPVFVGYPEGDYLTSLLVHVT